MEGRKEGRQSRALARVRPRPSAPMGIRAKVKLPASSVQYLPTPQIVQGRDGKLRPFLMASEIHSSGN